MRFSLILSVATTVLATPPEFYKGFDLSSRRLFELGGYTFKDVQHGNKTRNCEDIFGKNGMNTVRLRLWVDPTTGDQYGTNPGDYGLNYTLPLAKRVELSIVSIDNEIRNGLLWPVGKVGVNILNATERGQNFTNAATLLKSGRQGITNAVQAGVLKPEVMIHIDDDWNVTLQQDCFTAITGRGQFTKGDWDIFGFPFYPFYGIAATLENLAVSLNTIAAEYRKPVHVVETDWPDECTAITDGTLVLSDTDIPIFAKGQTEWVRDIGAVVQNVAYGLGQGVNYWER